jgi:predicted dinucleotide-binding enzyme
MNIGIIGAGNIGATLAELLTQADYAIAISNSRGPESLQELVARLGPNSPIPYHPFPIPYPKGIAILCCNTN